MKTQKIDGFKREGVTHEDSDQFSSSESCTNSDFAFTEAVSSRVKRKNKLRSSEFLVDTENKKKKKIQRKFRELSSVVPGFMNTKDEDLMLDDAINYLKRLQKRACILEEQNKSICVEKTWVCGDNDVGESSSSSIYQFKQGLPEIKAKAQGKDVLIRIHCQNTKGYLTKVIGEIEKLRLNVKNISSLPFGEYFLDITVIAQANNDEYYMTMKDLKRELTEALQLFMR